MKTASRSALAIAFLLFAAIPAAIAEPAAEAVHHGILFLPLDFYPDHREQLGLDDGQVRRMEEIIHGMREHGEKLDRLIDERTRALHQAVAENPANTELAVRRFKEVLEAENEMKMLQFGTRMKLREVLRPEQYEKVRQLAAKHDQPRAREGGDLGKALEQVRLSIEKRHKGEPPREVAERLEHIEQAARHGRMQEAREQLGALLRDLEDKEPGRHEDAPLQKRMEKLERAIQETNDPEQRERLQNEMRELREARKTAAKTEHPAGRVGKDLDQQMRRIAEAAERADNPEVRERLQHALGKLREAAKQDNAEVIEDILRAVDRLLDEGNAKR